MKIYRFRTEFSRHTFSAIAALMLTAAIPLGAAQFYVAPTGSASGDGSIGKPWDFHTALMHPAAVKAGDTIWMRGGTFKMSYPEEYTDHLTGTAAAPIVVRAYPGEHPIIDLSNLSSELYVYGAYTWFWGLEITSSGIPRSTNISGSWGAQASTIGIHGVGVKFINCFVHDLSQGFSFWNESEGSELTGNVIFHNGWSAPDRGHGHNVYVQNNNSGLFKTVIDNFIGVAFDVGMQEYGGGKAFVSNITATGNVMWDNGTPVGQEVGQLIIGGGGESKKGIEVGHNWIYTSSTRYSGGYVQIGWSWDGVNQDANIHDNFVWGPDLEIWHWNTAQVVRNSVFTVSQPNTLYIALYDAASPAQSLSNWNIDYNTYGTPNVFRFAVTGLDSNYNPTNTGGNAYNNVTWPVASKQESHSTFNAPVPTTATVRPNKYETGRANIVVTNPKAAATVAANLSTSGLNDGDSYVILDAQNFGGPAIVSGTYSSANPVVQIPMLNLTVAPIPGWSITPAHTAPYFGTFVLLGGAALTGSGAVPPPTTTVTDTTAPTVSIGAPVAGATVSGSVTVTASASDNTGVVGVQFKLDGSNLGSEVTASPYTATWSTSGLSGSHTLTAVARDAAGNQTPSSSVTVTVSNATVVTTATAAFVRLDTATQGNWNTAYGADGTWIANLSTTSPSYASISSAASLWTWAASSADARALLKPGLTDRIASAVYSSGAYTVDLNLSDSKTHQVAFYFVDWDANSRAETIEILDAGNSTVLSTQTMSSFTAGKYLVWNLSGHVQIRITKTSGGSNGVLSGLFFGAAATAAPVADTTVPTVSFSAPATGQSLSGTATVTATASDNTGVAGVQFKFDGTSLGAEIAAAPYTFTWDTTAVTNGSHTLSAVARDAAGNKATATVTIAVQNTTTPATASGNVQFVELNTAAAGTWKGVFGGDGHMLAGQSASLPSYAKVTVSGANTYVWADTTPDLRGLQKVTTADRLAAAFYAGSAFTIDVNLTDGATHKVAIYCADWDSTVRVQTVDVLDTAGNVLATRSLSSFNGGRYLVWNITGHVTLRLTKTVGPNAVVGGIFFGPASSATATAPTVSITAPAAGQSVSGTVTLTASASAAAGMASVQFLIDGSTAGTALAAAPYSFVWDSTSATNGNHTVSAIATDTLGSKTSAAAVTIAVSNTTTTAPAGTIAATNYWSFDTADIGGATALDRLGNRSGVIANATPVTGKYGQALAFNGANSSVTVNDSGSLQFNSSLSIAAWVKTTNTTRIETIVSKYDSSGSESGYLLKTLPGGTIGVRLGADVTSGTREFADTTKINDGLWHHVAVVVTMGQDIRFYVDGVLSSMKEAITTPASSGVPFQIGSMSFTYYAYPFTGTMDEVKFFRRALSATDVASLYAGN
jgi:hypothetical protein